jgi:hypothetical protein
VCRKPCSCNQDQDVRHCTTVKTCSQATGEGVEPPDTRADSTLGCACQAPTGPHPCLPVGHVLLVVVCKVEPPQHGALVVLCAGAHHSAVPARECGILAVSVKQAASGHTRARRASNAMQHSSAPSPTHCPPHLQYSSAPWPTHCPPHLQREGPALQVQQREVLARLISRAERTICVG